MSHPEQASVSAPLPPHGLNLKDIQAGPLVQLAKRNEVFIFFVIANVDAFCTNLKNIKIATTEDAQDGRTQISRVRAQRNDATHELAGTNIAFSAKGLRKLGFDPASLGDDAFTAGQRKRAQSLGDTGTGDGDKFDPTTWLPQFKQDIDGIITIAGSSAENVEGELKIVTDALSNSITHVHRVNGKARRPPNKGKEHFGFMDGVSQPIVTGIAEPLPGQTVVDPGVLIIGQNGDSISDRPPWARNGSILVYRHLKQFAPEFHKFAEDVALGIWGPASDIPTEAAFIAARMVGRWPSGCPLPVSPLKDNEEIGGDKLRNNLFDFTKPKPDNQEYCPFAAHVRKVGPRTDVTEDKKKKHSILRAGIAYGEEVSETENANHTTTQERGLAFVCFQSSLDAGFEFIQKTWSNDATFPRSKPEIPGNDPLISQNGMRGPRQMSGLDFRKLQAVTNFPNEFVVSQGGEYFFAPSITFINFISGASQD